MLGQALKSWAIIAVHFLMIRSRRGSSLQEINRRKPIVKNRVVEALERAVIETAVEFLFMDSFVRAMN